MADPIVDNIVYAVVVLVIVLAVITFIELKYLRKAIRGRQIRTREKGELPDLAHNAILTGKAISDTLRTSGVITADADEIIREAEVAYRNRNYRVTLDLADRAKGILKAAKARHDAVGDLARLERSKSGEGEGTTKEYLHKELPPNYMQAKFTISLAEERIEAATGAGRDTAAAVGFLATARARFDAKDYDVALKQAVRSRRSADGEPDLPPDTPVAPSVAASSAAPMPTEVPKAAGRACGSCGAELLAGDEFCRKCGVKVERPTACGTCGASLRDDDAFCRKCGATVG